jgi:hypothetical protein
VQTALWARAGGRCQLRGCNKLLIGDLITGKRTGKYGYIAHIVADSADGPRGDPIRSPLLAKDIDNLMLLCPVHHKAIDVDHLADYPESLLLEMKSQHEERIEIVTDMDIDRRSHVVRFAASIGNLNALVSQRAVFNAMPPDRHPADFHTIDIEVSGLNLKDNDPAFWSIQSDNLQKEFDRKIKQRVEQKEIQQLSVFALAPQPLLIQFGTLLGDIMPAVVHQKHREPDTWKWQSQQPSINFLTSEYDGPANVPVALKLGISATITDDRIFSVIGENAAIWSIAAENPHNDIMRRPDDLTQYKRHLRRLFDRIKAHHGEGAVINVFPAVPVSVAVESGRIWMPKADLALKIYDQSREAKAFVPTLTIGG